VSNPAFDQLNTRLSEDTGMFGFLTVRTIDDKDKCLKYCVVRKTRQKHYIIVLEDEDIHEMIKLRARSKIDKFLDKKMKQLKFESL